MLNIPTQDDLELRRYWRGVAALCMLIVFCFGTLFACYASVLKLAGQNEVSPLAAQVVAIATVLLVILPGGVLWKALRPRSKRAALYGLLLSSVLSLSVVASIGNL